MQISIRIINYEHEKKFAYIAGMPVNHQAGYATENRWNYRAFCIFHSAGCPKKVALKNSNQLQTNAKYQFNNSECFQLIIRHRVTSVQDLVFFVIVNSEAVGAIKLIK